MNQGVSERRVTSASKCLEALDTRLFGVPCSGGGVKSSAGSEERDGHGQTIYIHRRVTYDAMKNQASALVQLERRTWWDVSRPTLAELALISAPTKQPQLPVIAHSLV